MTVETELTAIKTALVVQGKEITGIKAAQAEMKAVQAVQGEQIAEIKAVQAVQGEQILEIKALQADIKTTLGQFLPIMLRLLNDVGENKGRAEGVPTARDFGRLEGRVDALEARQPTTLAYQSPEQRRPGGGS
ncbi:MAG: hypothetical protein WCF85_10440 [Rhodospirillaceae bacterium]